MLRLFLSPPLYFLMSEADVALSGPSVLPADGQAVQQAVIFLHGYGADGNDLIDLAPMLADALPGTAFYSPNAPQPCEMGPFGRQWFSLSQYDPEMLRRNPATLAPAYAQMQDGTRAAAPDLSAYIDSVAASHGIGRDRVALVGFSQGTMMALHVGLRTQPPVAAVVGFSGALIGAETLEAELVDEPPPVLLIHGDADQIVPIAAMGMASRALEDAGVDVNTMTCAGLEHGIDRDGLELTAGFLAHVFGL